MSGALRSTAGFSATTLEREAAFAIIERGDSTPSARLRAARYLALVATTDDRAHLVRLRSRESNSWVQLALEQAIARANGTGVPSSRWTAEPEPEPNTRIDEELRAQATEAVAELFLHELNPLVGVLDLVASQEVADYQVSRTRRTVEGLKALLDAIDRLRTASGAPVPQEFDLTDLVGQVIAAAVESGQAAAISLTASGAPEEGEGAAPPGIAVRIIQARDDPVPTSGDPALVRIALHNILRNAIEATETGPKPHGEVVINWGVTDLDSWIAVLDEGSGLPEGADRLFEAGISTKTKGERHFGLGLATALRALESLRGTIRLNPRSPLGVSAEIRWPKEGLSS